MATQHQKIINLCLDGKFHCQNEFRNLYIYSPHKRRNEIAGKVRESDKATGKYDFTKIKCQHGVAGQFDYMMTLNPDWSPEKEKAKDINLNDPEQFAKTILC